MNFLKKYLAFAMCLAILSGCGSKTSQDLEAYKKDFKDENINVFLKSFSDHRQGRALVLPEGPDVIRSYKPQNLTNGQALPLLGYYLYHATDLEKSNSQQSIGIDISVRDIKTLITSGNLASGKYGYYYVSVKARAILRDMSTNDIIDTFPVMIHKDAVRSVVAGRAPSIAQDRDALVQLIDEAALDLADDVLKETKVIANKHFDDSLIARMFNSDKKSREESVSKGKKYTPLNKVEGLEVESISEEDLGMTPEMVTEIEAQEEEFLNRKEEQRAIFEQKLEDQKYTEFLDSKQL